MLRCLLAVFCVFPLICLSDAQAAEPPSNAELFEMVKALQGRVAALERENETLRRGMVGSEMRQNEVPNRMTTVSFTPNSVEQSSPQAMLVGPPDQEVRHQSTTTWSGWYWGASFGLGKTRADSSADRTGGLGVAGPDDNGGALIDMSFGRNWQFRRRLVAGLQLEGSLAALDFDSRGVFTNIAGSQPYVSSVESDWMVSALARVGVLLGPEALLYGIAGWTHAHFGSEVQFIETTGFDANAPTFGVGFEKRLGPSWAFATEYRFTDFGEEDVPFSHNDLGSIRSGEDRFGNEMHIGRIGIKRYLNGG